MVPERLEEKFSNYVKALIKLEESLEREETDDIVIDAVIQRFEFTYELSWKLLKAYFSYSGIAEVRSPREAFKEAFSMGLINDGTVWIDMLNDRNLTSHTYNQMEAKAIYNKIKSKYYGILKKLKDSISKELKI